MTPAEKVAVARTLEGVRYSLLTLERMPSLGQIPGTFMTARNVIAALTSVVELLVRDALDRDAGERGHK